MKKLILLLFIFCAVQCYSQVIPTKIETTLVSNYQFTADTFNVTQTLYSDYTWGLQANWYGLDTTGATIEIVTSQDGINYGSYSGFLPYLITTTDGSIMFEDYMTNFKYFRVRVVRNSVTEGHLKLYFRAIKKNN